MNSQTTSRVLCLNAAAKRLRIPERTLRYRASRGRVPGAFKQGKLWKFVLAALLAVPSSPGADLRPAPPAFHLRDAKGHTLSLDRLKGKVVLLNFWATWRHGCQTEIPWYIEFEREYKSRGLAVVGISLDDGWPIVRGYLKPKKLNYPVALGDDELAKRYAVDNMPVSLLIDRHGQVAASHTGVVDRDAWEAKIRELLPEKR